jgi:transmembrane sensor
MIREVLSLKRLRAMDPDDAAAMLAVRRSDGASAYDDDALAAWLMHDEANVRAWERTQKAWLAFEDAEDDEILQAMRREARQPSPAAAWRPRLAAAAAAILVLVTGGFVVLQRGGLPVGGTRPGVSTPRIAAYPSAPAPVVTYASTESRPHVYDLPDGSRLTLDTESAVESDFTPAHRDLRLVRGRAFFEVRHDAQRPFVVHAAGREVVATGTRFDVRLYSESVRVVLVEGIVSVRSPRKAASPTILHAGQQLVDSPGMAPVVSAANVDETMNWQRGFVTFSDDTLAVAAAELNRYSRDQITIADPKIARMRVTGMFRAGDPMRFGRTLAEVHPVRMIRTAPNRLEIVSAQ